MVKKQKAFSIIELSQRNLSKSLRAGFQEVLARLFSLLLTQAQYLFREQTHLTIGA